MLDVDEELKRKVRFSVTFLAKPGPGKLPCLVSAKIPKSALKSAKLGRGCIVITQKGNISVFAPSSCVFVSVLSGHESRA